MPETTLDIIDEKQLLPNQEEIKYPAIFLLGAEGVGKSTLGNMLLGSYSEDGVSPIFPISDKDYDDEKEETYRIAEINIRGENYTIIDTIGIPESSTNTDQIWDKLKKVEKKAVKDVQVYIFVLEGGRLTQHELLFIHQLFTRYPKARTIVVFTKVRKTLILSRPEMEKTFNVQISTLLQSINGRWVVMPSLDLFGNNEGKSVIKNFVEDLKSMILKIEDKASVRKGIGSKRNKRFGSTRGVKTQSMEFKKKFGYGFLVVVVVTILIVVINRK